MTEQRGYRLEWLKVNKYRHVRPGTELHFDDDWNVLLGVNGTGKTTLLELVAACVSGDFNRLGAEDLDLEIKLAVFWGSVGYHISNQADPKRTGTIRPNGLVHALKGSFTAQATVAIDGISERVAVRIEDNGAVFVDDSPSERIEFDPRDGIHLVVMLAIHSRLSPRKLVPILPSHTLVRFDEALGYFDRLVAESNRLKVFVDETNRVVTNAVMALFMPEDFWLGITGEALLPGARALPVDERLQFKELEFLRTSAASLGFAEASLTMSRKALDRSSDGTAAMFGPLEFHFTTAARQVVPSEHLSFGQKRLFALHHYLALGNEAVVADELVNGLHHEMIEDVLRLTTGRQRFLASQNPLLLDHVPFSSLEDAKRRLIRCTSENGEMVWSNLSDREATVFYRAYDAGIQHVGEILRTTGLW